MSIYNTSAALAQTKNDVDFLEAGIHDNVVMTGIRKATTENGNKFIEFAFLKDNDKASHTEWETKRTSQDTDETFEKKQLNQISRILQIMGCFVTEDKLSFVASNFDEFTEMVIRILGESYKNVPVRIKLVYNNKGYTTLPNYAVYTFIENMNVTKSKIKKLAIDVFVKPTADTDNGNANPFTPKNDLPF